MEGVLWLYAWARFAGWASLDPVLGAARLPWFLRLSLAGALAAVTPSLVGQVPAPLTVPGGLALALEFLLGASFSLVLRILLGAAQTALAWGVQAAGWGSLAAYAPEAPAGTAMLRRLGFWLALLVFLGAHGEALLVQALLKSLGTLPPGHWAWAQAVDTPRLGAVFFALALQLALPWLALGLMAQMAFAVLSRLLPGVDAYAHGYAWLALVLLFSLAWLLPGLLQVLPHALSQAASFWPAALR